MKKNGITVLVSALLLAATPVMAGPACVVKAQIAAAPNMDVDENSLVQLNGEPSKNALTYLWEQTAGTKVILSATDIAKPTFTAPNVDSQGEQLTFKLTVTGCSQTTSTSINVNVRDSSSPNVNTPPSASFTIKSYDTETSVVNEGDPVTLDGRLSSDPENDQLFYSWEQIGEPKVILISPEVNSATATFTAPQVPYPDGATLTFMLTVSDGILTNSQTKTVTVKWINDPPRIVLDCPATVDERAPVTLDGSRSTDDVDAAMLIYGWMQTQANPVADIPVEDLSLPSITFAAPQLTSTIDTMKFQLSVTDSGPLHSTAECAVKVLDKTPPKLNLTNFTAEATAPSGAVVVFDPAPTARDVVDGPVDITCSRDSGSIFALGSTTVTCSAIDKAGNSSANTFEVTVQDNTPPVIEPHGHITAEATGANGAIVIYTPPSTDDIVDGPGTASCLPVSGSVFPLGINTVTCSATDKANNTATDTFEVTVQDTTPPVIAPHGNLIAEATNKNGAVISYTSPATADIVDGAGRATCLPEPETIFPLGVTTVTCNAQDRAKNTATATTFTVTVRDTTPPVIAPHEDVTTIATGTVGAAVTFAPPATTDLVDDPGTADCLPASGNTFPLGTTTVTCSATDKAGNSAAATTFKVTVNYGFNGLLAPYVIGKSYKIKSTIPIKWQYTNSAGVPMPSSAAKPVVLIYYVNANDTIATDALLLDDSGNSGYQYDSTTNTWQFNWKTTGLGFGTYHVYVQSTQTGQKDCPYPVQLTR